MTTVLEDHLIYTFDYLLYDPDGMIERDGCAGGTCASYYRDYQWNSSSMCAWHLIGTVDGIPCSRDFNGVAGGFFSIKDDEEEGLMNDFDDNLNNTYVRLEEIINEGSIPIW